MITKSVLIKAFLVVSLSTTSSICLAQGNRNNGNNGIPGQIFDLQQQIDSIELTPGPVGPMGPAGPPGVQGPRGPAGVLAFYTRTGTGPIGSATDCSMEEPGSEGVFTCSIVEPVVAGNGVLAVFCDPGDYATGGGHFLTEWYDPSVAIHLSLPWQQNSPGLPAVGWFVDWSHAAGTADIQVTVLCADVTPASE